MRLAALWLVVACGDATRVADSELDSLLVVREVGRRGPQMDRLADPTEFAHAIAAGLRDLKALPEGTLTINVRTIVREGDATHDELIEDIALSWNGAGDFHLVNHNSADYGREVLFVDNILYLRARYGRWHRRAPNDAQEPSALADSMTRALPDAWDLLAPGATLSPDPKDNTIVTIHTGATARENPREASPTRRWREARTIHEAAGRVQFANDGLPRDAALSGRLGFSREGRRFDMDLAVTAHVTATRTPWTMPPAADVFATPATSHEAEEREQLLEGLAPRKLGQP